jgi:dihydropteroate synthase
MYEYMVEIVGILNLTPDSFSDGNKYNQHDLAIDRAKELFADGAAIVDVGAESTRPKATPIDAAEEWKRLDGILPELIKACPEGRFSLDTRHAETAEKALSIDERIIINDVSGMKDDMLEVVAKHGGVCVIGHIPRGKTLETVHEGEMLEDISIVCADLLVRADIVENKGIPKDNIILDPLIGFGKSKELNWELLEFAKRVPEYAVMIGYSKKRFLGGLGWKWQTNVDAGKIVAEAAKNLERPTYLRVHDVKEHVEFIDLGQDG